MSGETTFAKIAYAEAADEVNKFPVNVSAPGAKTIDKYLEEHTLTIKKRAASYNAVSGELGLQESNAKTTTLPAAAPANQIIGVTSVVAEAKVTTSGGAVIYGKWLTVAGATSTVIVTEDMTAYFQSDGTNWILWGEIKDERKPSKAEITSGVAVKPSASRPALVTVMAEMTAANLSISIHVEVAGVANAYNVALAMQAEKFSVGTQVSAPPFPVAPGQEYTATAAGGAPKLFATTQLL